MKPFASAVVGAAMIGGTFVGLSSVAFASEIRGPSSAPAAAAKHPVREAVKAGAHDAAGTCRADGQAHAGPCTCARCTAAQAE